MEGRDKMTDALSEYDCNAWRTRLDTLMHDATLATTLRWEQEIRALATIDRLRAVNAKLLSALEAMVRHGEHDGPCTNESGDPRTPDTYEGEGCLLHWQTSEQRTVRAREAIEEARK